MRSSGTFHHASVTDIIFNQSKLSRRSSLENANQNKVRNSFAAVPLVATGEKKKVPPPYCSSSIQFLQPRFRVICTSQKQLETALLEFLCTSESVGFTLANRHALETYGASSIRKRKNTQAAYRHLVKVDSLEVIVVQ